MRNLVYRFFAATAFAAGLLLAAPIPGTADEAADAAHRA